MRIGNKKIALNIELRNKPTKWHDGKYTVMIWLERESYMHWWMFIPSGKPHMGWVRFIRREWVNFRLLFR